MIQAQTRHEETGRVHLRVLQALATQEAHGLGGDAAIDAAGVAAAEAERLNVKADTTSVRPLSLHQLCSTPCVGPLEKVRRGQHYAVHTVTVN